MLIDLKIAYLDAESEKPITVYYKNELDGAL